jgi:hypothetical protein
MDVSSKKHDGLNDRMAIQISICVRMNNVKIDFRIINNLLVSALLVCVPRVNKKPRTAIGIKIRER